MWKHIDLLNEYLVTYNKVIYRFLRLSNYNFHKPSCVFKQRKGVYCLSSNSKLFYETTKERVGISETPQKLFKIQMLFWFYKSVVGNPHFINISKVNLGRNSHRNQRFKIKIILKIS